MVREGNDRVSLFMAVAAIIVIGVGVFLPLWDEGSVVFTSLQGNSLVQSGTGWYTVAVLAWSAYSIARAFQGQPIQARSLVAPGAVVLGLAVYNGTSDQVMTLCPIGATSTTAAGCQLAQPGLGIYATGFGGALLIAAGVLLWKSHEQLARSHETIDS